MEWQASGRYVGTSAERPRWRFNVARRVTPRAQIGLEYNPAADEVTPTANWVAMTETEALPMVSFGTSSDRIFSPPGKQAYFVTAAKSLGDTASPYIGLSWSSWEDTLLVPFGCNFAITPKLDGLVLNDGRNTHFLLTVKGQGTNASLLLVKGRYWGVSLGWGW